MRTYVLDASAVIIFLQKKPAAGKVNELLKDGVRGRVEILMSAVNYGEVYGTILRDRGRDQALAAMSALQPLPIRLIDVTPERALRAADLKARYKLNYLDAFAALLALEFKATLVTSDSDFRRLGHTLRVTWLRT